MIKICFVGLGSIGQRHIKNVVNELKKRNQDFSIDAIRHSDKVLPQEINELLNNQYYSFDEIAFDYDVIFVTNPTVDHFDTISKALCHTKHLFIEKPVFYKHQNDMNSLNLKNDGVYYVACPMRYDAVLENIKGIIKEKDVISVRAISSSYLPNWRKGVDYRNNYSAKKEMGGGVTLDLIHEIDYITWLFGMPQKCINVSGKYSNLEISSDDISVYILVYENMLAEVHLDYIGRETVRNIEILCNDCKVVGDFINKTVYIVNDDGLKTDFCVEQTENYILEMKNFWDMVFNGKVNENDIFHANDVLGLIESGKMNL